MLLSTPIAVRITGNDAPLIEGQSATITCSSDLDVVSIQWLYNGLVEASSLGAQADLVFSSVPESIHNREYVCRVNTATCSAESSTTISVEGTLINV